MALQAQGQPGDFDSSAWGEGPWEGEMYSVAGGDSLMSWTWLRLPAQNRKGRWRTGQGARKGTGRRSQGKINLEENLF